MQTVKLSIRTSPLTAFEVEYGAFAWCPLELPVDMTPDKELQRKRCYSRIAAKLELARTISEYEAV